MSKFRMCDFFTTILVAGVLYSGCLTVDADAQWQVPVNTIPIGRGPGVTGFNSVANTGTGNLCLLNTAPPTFGACLAGNIVVGTTTITGGTPGQPLWNNGGVLANSGIVNSMVASGAAIDSTKLSYTLPLTGGVAQTASNRFMRTFYLTDFGAAGDGTTDDGPAFRTAVTNVPDGSQIILSGTTNGYLVNSCVNNAVVDMTGTLGNKAVSFVGQGYNLKGVGVSTPSGSVVKLGASIPSGCDFFHQAGNGTVFSGITMKDFAVIPSGGLGSTPVGRHAFFFDGSVSTSFYTQELNFNGMFIDNMSTGYSLNTTAQAGSSGGTVAHSIFQNSNFVNVNMTLVGDNITFSGKNIIGDVTGGGNPTLNTGIYWTNCDGCAAFRILGGLIVSRNGMITTDKAINPIIQGVEMESPAGVANSAGYLVNMRGTTATIQNPTITNNIITQNSAVGAYLPIKLDNSYGGTVKDNYINVAVAAAHVTTTASTFNTQLGNNTCYLAGSATACSYASGGINQNRIDTTTTIFFPGGVSGQTALHASAVANGDLSLPAAAATDTLVGNTTAATLTNKSMSGASNTFTNIPVSTAISGLGTGVGTALGVNVGSAGAFVTFNGALGTPSSGTLTGATGLPISTGVSGLGTGVATALGVNVGTAGSPVINGGALGSPSSIGTLPAYTLGGTISGGGNQINNVVIGTTTPLAGTFTTLGSGVHTVTSSSAGALVVGPNGATNPVLTIDGSGASQASGLTIKGQSAGNGTIIQATSSAADELLSFSGKGAGQVYFGALSTGLVHFIPVSVFGSGSIVGSSGEVGITKITASGSAPGAGTCKISAVAGTTGGTCKLIAYCGTSTTATTILDNIGTGC